MSGQGIEKMKLEVGKKYLNREGRVIEIIDFSPTSLHYKYSDGIDTFTEDGFQWRDKRHSPNDLVSEYTEDKVFKIEAGKYYISRDGNYKIGPVQEKGNDLAFPLFAEYKSLKTEQTYNWWLTSSGRWDDYKDQDYRDAVAEFKEENVFKLEEGKRYYTRNGGITDPVQADSGNKQPFYAVVHNKDNKNQGLKWFNKNGQWLTEGPESEWDLVKEYEEKKKLTLPLEVGKKYVTNEGKVIEAIKLDSDINMLVGKYWYDPKNGKFLGYENDNDYEDYIVADYIEDEVKIPKMGAKKEKKKPIKYSDLTFYEAWSLAKETKKRYRLKGSEWLEFPNVKVNKETFALNNWEVEK